jgi:hypothetical protein
MLRSDVGPITRPHGQPAIPANQRDQRWSCVRPGANQSRESEPELDKMDVFKCDIWSQSQTCI